MVDSRAASTHCHPDRSSPSADAVEGYAVCLPLFAKAKKNGAPNQPQIPRLTAFARNDKVFVVLCFSFGRTCERGAESSPRRTKSAHCDAEISIFTTSPSERSGESRECTLHRPSHHPLDSSLRLWGRMTLCFWGRMWRVIQRPSIGSTTQPRGLWMDCTHRPLGFALHFASRNYCQTAFY